MFTLCLTLRKFERKYKEKKVEGKKAKVKKKKKRVKVNKLFYMLL